MARREEGCHVGLLRVEVDALAVESQQQCLRVPPDLCVRRLGLRDSLIVLCANKAAHASSEV